MNTEQVEHEDHDDEVMELAVGLTEESNPNIYIALGDDAIEMTPPEALEFVLELLKVTHEAAMLSGVAPGVSVCH